MTKQTKKDKKKKEISHSRTLNKKFKKIKKKEREACPFFPTVPDSFYPAQTHLTHVTTRFGVIFLFVTSLFNPPTCLPFTFSIESLAFNIVKYYISLSSTPSTHSIRKEGKKKKKKKRG
jgi:hypothetical protein